jgi:rhamnosyltransferase
MKNKIAACIILYNPDVLEVTKNISTYIEHVSKLYIYDNSENKSHKDSFNNNSKIQYFSDLDNKGIAYRLNQACKTAINEGFEFLLTMDQDSFFTENNLETYIHEISTFKDINTIATFGIEYNANDLTFDKKYIEVDHVITSGCIINLNLYNTVGGFDENLFIDYVDTDYCYNTINKGFKNIKYTSLFLNHSLGEIKKRKSLTSLYLKSKRRPIHSNIRIYYMWRNMLYMKKKYQKSFPEHIENLEKRQKKYIYRCINYSENAWEAIKMFQKAKKDFKNNKMGKIEN